MSRKPSPPVNPTRRRFLLYSITGATTSIVVIFGFKVFRQNWNQVRNLRHSKGRQDNSPFPKHILTNIVLFTGALMGKRLNEEDKIDLFTIYQNAINWDSHWRTEYRWLSDHIDSKSKAKYKSDFASVNYAKRNELVKDILQNRNKIYTKKSRMIAVFYRPEIHLHMMFKSTIPNLRRNYAFSSVPWRARGYYAWPTLPRNQTDYMVKGPSKVC